MKQNDFTRNVEYLNRFLLKVIYRLNLPLKSNDGIKNKKHTEWIDELARYNIMSFKCSSVANSNDILSTVGRFLIYFQLMMYFLYDPKCIYVAIHFIISTCKSITFSFNTLFVCDWLKLLTKSVNFFAIFIAYILHRGIKILVFLRP